MKNAVIFTGLPRTPDRFERSVTEMADLRRQGLIDRLIFVTWQGRLNDKDRVRSFLDEAGVEVIEKKEASEGGWRNIWHQMRALEFGLEAIPSNDYRVLKTRSDVHIKKKFLRELLSGDIDYRNTPAKSGVFKERVWVPFFRTDLPFFLCDYCFYGQKQDLEKLVNFDARFDFLYDVPRGLTEVRRFIHPYLKNYPFLRLYLRNYDHQDSYLLTDREGALESRLNSSVYASFLAFYYNVMQGDFYINYAPVTFRGGEWLNAIPSEDASEFESIFLDNLSHGPHQGQYDMFCYRTDWLENKYGGEPSSEIPDQLLNQMERSFDEWREYRIDPDALRSDIERDKQFYDTTNYPGNSATRWVAGEVLEPLGLKEPIKRLYRRML